MASVEKDLQALMEQRAASMQTKQSDSSVEKAPAVVFQDFVLYVSERPNDIGSQTIQTRIEPIRENFKIINVADIEEELPDWLNGTPILVDTRTSDGLIYKGTAALDMVNDTYMMTDS